MDYNSDNNSNARLDRKICLNDANMYCISFSDFFSIRFRSLAFSLFKSHTRAIREIRAEHSDNNKNT